PIMVVTSETRALGTPLGWTLVIAACIVLGLLMGESEKLRSMGARFALTTCAAAVFSVAISFNLGGLSGMKRRLVPMAICCIVCGAVMSQRGRLDSTIARSVLAAISFAVVALGWSIPLRGPAGKP